MDTWTLIIYVLTGLLAYCVVGFIFGYLCRYLCESKGHTEIKSFMIGFFLWFVGLLFAFFLPNLDPAEQKVIVVHEYKEETKKDD